MKIRRVGAELLHMDGRTDRLDMTELTVALRNFANASKDGTLVRVEITVPASQLPSVRLRKSVCGRQTVCIQKAPNGFMAKGGNVTRPKETTTHLNDEVHTDGGRESSDNRSTGFISRNC
jgi:hypothetical protein